jgi:hypothetical protein
MLTGVVFNDCSETAQHKLQFHLPIILVSKTPFITFENLDFPSMSSN